MYPQQLSHGNVLTFIPPGFKQSLNVKFPDSRLAVCEKCKKNYKTRDMCRVRNAHTAEPWTTAYMCFTLDDNCTDENGKFVEKPLAVRMIQWQPYCVKKPFDPKTPVCSACKKTNRTRSFCRERHKHRQLPWCTVYVLLSPSDSIDPATRVAPESVPLSSVAKCLDPDKSDDDGKCVDETRIKGDVSTIENPPIAQAGTSQQKKSGEESDDGDDIYHVSESRTFLAKVSCRHKSIHWLERAEFDAADAAAVHALVPADSHPALSRTIPMQSVDTSQYYTLPMTGYSAQQHQFNLKSHQQYFFQMQQRTHQAYAAQAQWQQQYNQQNSVQLQHASNQLGSGIPTGGAPTRMIAGEIVAESDNQNQHVEQSAGAAAAAAQQQIGNSQWAYHQQMYQNQMAQFQQSGGIIPPQVGQSTNGDQSIDYSQHVSHDPDDIEPSPVHDVGDDREENEVKRTRFV